MNCRFEQELLTGYLDGELDGRDKGAVEEHIASCSECLRALGEIKSLAGHLRALPHMSAPATVAEIVRRETGSRFARMRAWFQAGIAAAALALVGISVVIVSTRPETRPETVAAATPRGGAPAEPLTRPQANEKAAADEGRVADQLRKTHNAAEQALEKKQQDKADQDLAERSRETRDDDHNESELKRLEKEGGGWGTDDKKDQLGGAKGDPKTPADAAPGRELAKGETKGKFKEEAEKLGNKAEPAPSENAPKPAGPAPDAPATMRGKKSAEAAAVPVVVVRSPQLGKTRQDVEALLADFARRGAKSVVGAPDVGDNAYVKDRCVTVELTEAEYEALQKLLGSMKSVEIASGSLADEKERSTAWRRRQGADRNADAEELAQAQDYQKQGADGKADAPPAPAKQPAEPAKDAGATKEMDKSKDDPAAGGGGAGFSGKPEAKGEPRGGRAAAPVARKRYILVFEDKTPPPAAPDKK